MSDMHDPEHLEDDVDGFDALLTGMFDADSPDPVDEAFVARVEHRLEAPARARTLTLGGVGSLAGLIAGSQIERFLELNWAPLEHYLGGSFSSYGPELIASICVGGVLMAVSVVMSQRA